MKHLIFGILKATPKLMERTTLSVSLSGWPATVAITSATGMICGTIAYAAHTRLKQKELDANQSKSSSAEGVAEETAEGALLDDSYSRENPSSL